MKKIFIIDWSLIPVFVLSAYSGIELHVADYEGNHEVWHNWAVFHVLTSLLFLMASIFHIATHWGWYKGTAKNGIGRKSKVTAVLSVLFLSVVLTGFALLGIEGAGSPVGQCHFWAGIVTTVLSIGHILKRLPSVSYTHLRAHETRHDLVCRLLLEKKKKKKSEHTRKADISTSMTANITQTVTIKGKHTEP